MREYLFKANRIDNGEEVIGSLLQGIAHDKECAIIVPKSELFSMIGTSFCDECNRHYDIDYEVIPETVRQFTGLLDKNGKKIFEGDILRCWYDETSKNTRQTVKVFFEKGQFVVDHYAIKTLFDRNTNCEIIGNIHDNKELLEVEE